MNVAQGKFFGMKSHDGHIFMECLMSVALREFLDHCWMPLINLSEYFIDLFSSTLRVDDLLLMEKDIPLFCVN